MAGGMRYVPEVTENARKGVWRADIFVHLLIMREDLFVKEKILFTPYAVSLRLMRKG